MSLFSVVIEDDNFLFLPVINVCSREVFCSHLILLTKAVVSYQDDCTDMSLGHWEKKNDETTTKEDKGALNTCKLQNTVFKG